MAYGWQMGDLLSKSKELSNTPKDIEAKEIYQEMIADYSHPLREKEVYVNSAQWKRAIGHFNVANYQEEFDLLLYFGNLLSHLDLDLPTPHFVPYEESDVINLAKIYMRRKEPNDYPYFRKITNSHDRIQFCYTASQSSFWGKSYFLDRSHYYILINSKNGIQDAVTLLHETSHIENYLKYGINLSQHFAELSSMTREHYGFDTFRIYDESSEVEKQRRISLNHYLLRIMKLYNAINLILALKRNSFSLKYVLSDFEKFSTYFDIDYLFSLLSGMIEKELGYALSFIASLDIYLNCTPQESNLFITSYQIGTRRLSKKAIDKVSTYLLTTLEPYQKVKNI